MRMLTQFHRLAVSVLLASAAACADTVTNTISPVDPTTSEDANANAGPLGKLVVTTRTGTSADFAGLPTNPGTRPGLFIRVETTATDFLPGLARKDQLIVVDLNGGRHAISTAIGSVPASGRMESVYSESCPTYAREFYFVMSVGGRVIESNHVTPGC